VAARSLDHEQQDARRGALALDRLDQSGKLVTTERLELESRDRPRGTGNDQPVRPPRVVARDLVRTVGDNQGQPLVPGNPGEERRQGTGRSVGAMKVLE